MTMCRCKFEQQDASAWSCARFMTMCRCKYEQQASMQSSHILWSYFAVPQKCQRDVTTSVACFCHSACLGTCHCQQCHRQQPLLLQRGCLDPQLQLQQVMLLMWMCTPPILRANAEATVVRSGVLPRPRVTAAMHYVSNLLISSLCKQQ